MPTQYMKKGKENDLTKLEKVVEKEGIYINRLKTR